MEGGPVLGPIPPQPGFPAHQRLDTPAGEPEGDGLAGTDRAVAERDLLDRLRRGDEAAFARVVDEWSPTLLRVARSFVSTDASAQEVVQDTWLGVVRGLDRFQARSSLRTWVFSILANLGRTRGVRESRTLPWASLSAADGAGPTVDPRRFRGREDEWPCHWTPVGSPRPWQPSPEDAAVAGEVRGEVARALTGLPERQRTVVALRDVHGLSSDEVCAALAISSVNQRVLLHRGRARMRAALEDYYRGRDREAAGRDRP